MNSLTDNFLYKKSIGLNSVPDLQFLKAHHFLHFNATPYHNTTEFMSKSHKKYTKYIKSTASIEAAYRL